MRERQIGSIEQESPPRDVSPWLAPIVDGEPSDEAHTRSGCEQTGREEKRSGDGVRAPCPTRDQQSCELRPQGEVEQLPTWVDRVNGLADRNYAES